MEWLTQNWIWLALGIGAIFMISRGKHGGQGGGCCGGSGHGGGSNSSQRGSSSPKDTASGTPGHQHH